MITLLTDFGTTDPYAGMMKGVIASICPQAVVVDITHDIAPRDIIEAAHVLNYAHACFPPGTIHVAVVDPGVGSGRVVIAAEANDYLFLAPDNGLLGLVMDKRAVKRAVRVEKEAYFRHPVSRTFHGRDIFAPVAGHLAAGIDMDALGPRIESGSLVKLSLPVPEISEGKIIGMIIGIDRFGNLITNINEGHIDQAGARGAAGRIVIAVGSHRVFGLSETYGDASPGSMLALIGSRGQVEVSVNQGSAKDLCSASRGDRVSLAVRRP